ncbi:MAG TPA: cobyric acid synthase [Kineosporiaceae bacterium]|nr:cobyric acid synthase [Kineosporiaceae bacterium]
MPRGPDLSGLAGAILVAGASSDAGKSVLTAGICRWLSRQGIKVAPFKAQNMSNNSVVTADGGEIGRAQGVQAVACGLEPEAAMNPVLLKPGSDRTSHVVVMGRSVTQVRAADYARVRPMLREAVLAAYDDLRSRFDVVVCEGAGSAAEINLRAHDLANLGLADARDLPVLVVADIDRGGVFASLFGTVALLSARDQSLLAGFVINRFRGDPGLLAPGLEQLAGLTGRPTLGVLPWVPGLAFDAEDSLALDVPLPVCGPPVGRDTLRVAAVRLPRTSNATDVDALAAEPGVAVRWTTSPAEVAEADLAVLPGSRATVADLDWMHRQGLAAALASRAVSGRPVLGICGGFQMLARTIADDVESGAGTVAGLGLLPGEVRFAAEKTVRRVSGSAYGQPVTTAYEIHHGVFEPDPGTQPFLDGCRSGAVWGTTWHGALDSDGFRRAFLAEVAAAAGRDFTPAPDTDVAAQRAARLDAVADLVAAHLDTAALTRLIRHGAPSGLPFVPPGAPA